MYTKKIETQYLLTDEQMMDFIVRGYHLVTLPQPPEFHEAIRLRCNEFKSNPGNSVYDAVPALKEVYESPVLVGALASILGHDYAMNPHRHLHTTAAGKPTSQTWHQDGTNVRDRQVWTCLAMYYPQTVTKEMGPTAILAGTHLRNSPTDLMANYTNIRGATYLTVEAGTVAITHFDLWHAGTLNKSTTPRHMLKFLFDRQSEPKSPSWNHDPEIGDRRAATKVADMVGPPIGYCSDYYKEWELRKEMWLWLSGKDTYVPPGHFRNMLNPDSLMPMREKVFIAKPK
jgi:hypothetical protein